MGSVFRSKEVYKKLKYDLHGKNEIVAVRGVYVSGEYRPPYYNEPILKIYEISSQHATVVDFQDVAQSSGADSMVKIVDFKAERLIPQCQWYESKSQNAGEDSMVKIVDFVAEIYGGQTFTIYTKTFGESTPEPTLRLTSFTSELATVTNYTP